MSRDVDSVPDDDRVRSALRELARDAHAEPSRPLRGDVVSGSVDAGHPWRRAVAAVAAVALVGVAGVLLIRRTPEEVVVDEPPSTTMSAEPAAGWFTELAPDSAAVLPDAPITGRIGPVSVWTGSEMLVWGGADLVDNVEVPLADGAAFDPMTGLWRVLPVAPIEGRAYAATVWTGTEMIVWGGSRTGVVVGDGAAFDPTTNEWRTLPDSPVGPAIRSAAAWTGTEMIIIGGDASGGASAAYDPTTDRWRGLPDAPGAVTPPYPQAVWTGEAVLITIVDPEASLMQSFKLAMYRPEENEWEVVQEQFPSQFLVGVPGADLGMAGDDVVALTFSPGVSMPVLSPFGDIGLELGPKPSDLAGVGAWQPIWSGHEILLWSGSDKGLALDPLTDEWREFPAGDVAERTDGAIVWADGVLLAWGGFVSNRDGTASAADDGIIYRPRDPVAETIPPVGPLLGDIGDVRSDQWVYPSVLPTGVEYMFPQRQNRTVRFAAATDQGGYTVSIDASLDGPGTEPLEIPSVTSADVAGHTWEVVTTDDVWFATRQLESTSVTVSGPVEFDHAARAFIAGLVVVDEADLPSPPLDFDGDVIEVARYDGDGIAASVKVSESNGHYCIRIYDEFGGGGGGGCGVTLDPDETVSAVNFAVGPSGDSEGVRIDAAGIVSADVARVEIEFDDDTVTTTTPTDLSGQFNVGFWVAAAVTDTGVRIAHIRAYDSSGALLATRDLR